MMQASLAIVGGFFGVVTFFQHLRMALAARSRRPARKLALHDPRLLSCYPPGVWNASGAAPSTSARVERQAEPVIYPDFRGAGLVELSDESGDTFLHASCLCHRGPSVTQVPADCSSVARHLLT